MHTSVVWLQNCPQMYHPKEFVQAYIIIQHIVKLYKLEARLSIQL